MLFFLTCILFLMIKESKTAILNGTTANSGLPPSQVRIRCFENSIGIEVDNPEGREGRVYARRMGHDPNCVKHHTAFEKRVNLDIPFNFLPCGIESKRINHPRPGLEYTVTVILSRDHVHMTEDDQMYTLSCRYYSNHKDVGTVLEVSTYTRNYLIGGKNGPSCEYSLHYGSLNGPPAQNAKIGDKVYHEWRCADSSFGFKVYDCYVHDGTNNKFKLIDEDGCSKDKTIIPDLTYDPNLNFAFAASRVFKFAESTKMFFNCLLYMCPKSDPQCQEVVPPRCFGRTKRSIKRSINPHVNNWFSVNATLPLFGSGERSLEREPETDEVVDFPYNNNVVDAHYVREEEKIPDLDSMLRLQPLNDDNDGITNEFHNKISVKMQGIQTNGEKGLQNELEMIENNNVAVIDHLNPSNSNNMPIGNPMDFVKVQINNNEQEFLNEVLNEMKLDQLQKTTEETFIEENSNDNSNWNQNKSYSINNNEVFTDEMKVVDGDGIKEEDKNMATSTSLSINDFAQHTFEPSEPQKCNRWHYKKILLVLVVVNFVSLSITVVAIAILCHRRHSASMDIFRSYGA